MTLRHLLIISTPRAHTRSGALTELSSTSACRTRPGTRWLRPSEAPSTKLSREPGTSSTCKIRLFLYAIHTPFLCFALTPSGKPVPSRYPTKDSVTYALMFYSSGSDISRDIIESCLLALGRTDERTNKKPTLFLLKLNPNSTRFKLTKTFSSLGQ